MFTRFQHYRNRTLEPQVQALQKPPHSPKPQVPALQKPPPQAAALFPGIINFYKNKQ